MKLLNEKSVLITGAAGRIGSAVAKESLRMGASVFLTDLATERLLTLKENLSEEYPGKVFACPCDITNSLDVENMLRSATKDMGGITSAVHSAYPVTTTWGTHFEDLSTDVINSHLSMQLGSAILISQKLLEEFKGQGGGDLVHISSIQGVGAPKFDHYEGTEMYSPIENSAIKAGIISITKWLAKYYSGNSIRVNCVSPGGITSGQPEIFTRKYRESCTNFGMLTSDQVAGTVCFLLTDGAEAINGQNIIVDDGWCL